MRRSIGVAAMLSLAFTASCGDDPDKDPTPEASCAGASALTVKMPDMNADPAGGVCGETGSDPTHYSCFDDHRTAVTLTPEWQQFTVNFDDIAQNGWSGHISEFDSSAVFSVDFFFDESAGSNPFDIYLDEVAFAGGDALSIIDFETDNRTADDRLMLNDAGILSGFVEMAAEHQDLIAPTDDASVAGTAGGANETANSLHFTGEAGFGGWGLVALSFVDFDKANGAARTPADASSYSGVTFYAKCTEE